MSWIRRTQQELARTCLQPSDDDHTFLVDLCEHGWRFKFIVTDNYPFTKPVIFCQPRNVTDRWVRYIPTDNTTHMFMEAIALSIATDEEITDHLMKKIADM